jgi:hypothetical protein
MLWKINFLNAKIRYRAKVPVFVPDGTHFAPPFSDAKGTLIYEHSSPRHDKLSFPLRKPTSMKKTVLLALLTLSLATNASVAATVFSEDFSTNGALLGSTPDTGGNWTITGTSVVNPLTGANGVLDVLTTGQDSYAAFSSQAPTTGGTSLSMSFQLNVTAAQATGDYFLHLSDPAGTTSNFYNRIYAKSSTNAGFYQMGIASTSGTGSVITYGGDLALNATVVVSSLWTFVDGLANDTFSLTVGGGTYLSGYTWTGNAEPTAFVSAVNIRQGTGSNAPTLTIDNLTVETIPEVSSSLLMLSAALGLMRRRR